MWTGSVTRTVLPAGNPSPSAGTVSPTLAPATTTSPATTPTSAIASEIPLPPTLQIPAAAPGSLPLPPSLPSPLSNVALTGTPTTPMSDAALAPSSSIRRLGTQSSSTPALRSTTSAAATRTTTAPTAATFEDSVTLGLIIEFSDRDIDFVNLKDSLAVTGIIEYSDYRVRMRFEGTYDAALRALEIKETTLLAGSPSGAFWKSFRNLSEYVPGTVYRLSLVREASEDVGGDIFTSTFTSDYQLIGSLDLASRETPSPTESTELEKPASIVSWSVRAQVKYPFLFSSQLHGPAITVDRKQRTATLVNPSSSSLPDGLTGFALSQVGFSRGIHYWEFRIENTEEFGTVFVGVVERASGAVYPTKKVECAPNLGRWEKVPNTFGFINFRASWTTASAGSANGGGEVLYGEYFSGGDTVGVLLNLDIGEISFFVDVLKFGEHGTRDLGTAFSSAQLNARAPHKFSAKINPQTFFPAIGLRKISGAKVTLSPRHISFPTNSPETKLATLSLCKRLMSGHFQHPRATNRGGPREPLAKQFLVLAHAKYRRMREGRFIVAKSRAGGALVELDTDVMAMQLACEAAGMLASAVLKPGDRVRVLTSEGRSLPAPEEAIVLGTLRGSIWYSTQTTGAYEGTDQGSTWAWYWEPHELVLLEVLSSSVAAESRHRPAVPELSLESFSRQVLNDGFTREDDVELVRLLNIYMAKERVLHSANVFFGPSLSSILSSDSQISRVAVILALYDLIAESLPCVSLSNAKSTGTLGSLLSEARDLILYLTKRTFFATTLQVTTAPTTLPSDEYSDPPGIRTVNINRVRCTLDKLALIPSSHKRMKRSVLGQLYVETSKFSEQAFRRSFVGKGHGGQARAFKVRLVGEGVVDYGGPYRQVFECICDELQGEDPRLLSRTCVLPLFVPSPNRFSALGDFGRDKFTFNPSASTPSLLRRFEFLGKLFGVALRHGLNLRLDLPIGLFWRRLACLPSRGREDLREIDAAFVQDLERIDANPFLLFQNEREAHRVALSDGSFVDLMDVLELVDQQKRTVHRNPADDTSSAATSSEDEEDDDKVDDDKVDDDFDEQREEARGVKKRTRSRGASVTGSAVQHHPHRSIVEDSRSPSPAGIYTPNPSLTNVAVTATRVYATSIPNRVPENQDEDDEDEPDFADYNKQRQDPAVMARIGALYTEKALEARLRESELQLQAFRKGLGVVIPTDTFCLFAPHELELLVCGARELDVDQLKKTAEYDGNLTSKLPHIEWFWESLQEMSPKQRTSFLLFSYARSRLPTHSSTPLRITAPGQGTPADLQPDDFLPTAQTCFFSICLPRYTSKSILTDKLLKGAECTVMDADVRLHNAEGWGDV